MGMRAAILWRGFIVVVFTALGAPKTGHAATSLSIPPTVTSTGHQNDRLVAAGYLDVTLYGADSTGHNDSTAAIQNAINDGIKYSMTVYVPSGTYLVSNTLNGVQDCNDTNNYNFGAISKYGMHKAPSLVGPASGARPMIVLQDGSAGFSDPTHPKPLVYFVNTTANATTKSCSGQWLNSTVGAFDILFYGVIRDINFKLGSNPGAIGVRFFSAQYSYMQNVSVDAQGGFVGIEGAPATEVWTNIDVSGGQYGVVMDRQVCGTSTVAGLTLENQTVAGFSNTGMNGAKPSCGAITIVGFNFQESGSSAVSLSNPGIHGSTLDLIDGSITVLGTSQPAINNPAGMGVYMNDVYIKAPAGAPLISNNTTVAPASGAIVISPTASGGWDFFPEYAHNDSGTYNVSWGGGVPVDGYTVIGDVQTKNDFNSSSFKSNGAAPPSDLVSRNVPGQMPWAMDSSVIWATDYGADPTGKSDSTTAIRNAIAASLGHGDKVFLPRGIYNITGTLTLNTNTQLFGIPGGYTGLNGSAWVTNGVYQQFIQSANSKSSTSLISDIGVGLPSDDSAVQSYCTATLKDCTLFPPGFSYDPMDNTYLGALNWEAGRNSVLNQFFVTMQWDATTDLPSAARKLIQLRNGGGGRWYGLQINTSKPNDPIKNDNFRSLLATGTTEPLTLYGSNPEHLGGQTFYEFSGAANIRILGLKTEDGDNSSLMQMENGTTNVLVTGICGDFNDGTFILNDTANVSLANLTYYGTPGRRNQTSSAAFIVDSSAPYSLQNAYTLFKLGNFNSGVFDLTSSADTQPPSVPANVTLSNPSVGTVLVSFAASSDNVGVTGYKIYRGGTQVVSTASTTYADVGLVAGTYSYTVSAFDAAGNTSAQSAPVSIMLASQSGTATVSPNPASPGQTITVTSPIGSTTSVSPAMVVFWYRDAAGNLIGRTAITNLSFTANQMKSVSGTFAIPSSQATGTYSITATIYDSSTGNSVTQMSPTVSGSFTVQ